MESLVQKGHKYKFIRKFEHPDFTTGRVYEVQSVTRRGIGFRSSRTGKTDYWSTLKPDVWEKVPESPGDMCIKETKFSTHLEGDGTITTKGMLADDINTKDTNPKDAVGVKKPPMSTVSGPVLQEVGVAMLEGALKYGRHNYRAVGVRASVYYDAALRHLLAYWEGEDIDPDSGVSHLSKAIAGLVVLRDSEINGNMADDRPPRIDLKDHNSRVQEIVDKLLEKYPEPKEAFTHV